MTDNEILTIDEIIEHCNRTCENTEILAIARGQKQEDITSKGYWEHYQVANYLEELKQYREIGTVEELKTMKENGAFTGVELASLACMQLKLKDYQSIGTVEEFKELKNAEEQGLLLRLPCKVGTPVYMIAQDCNGDTLDCRYRDCEGCSYLYSFVEENAFDTYMVDDIGKTVFLTKEEAEQTLKQMGE